MEAMTFGTDKLKVILFCRNEARPSGNTGGLVVTEYNESNRNSITNNGKRGVRQQQMVSNTRKMV